MFSATGNHEVSRSYLARVDWNLEEALDLYFTESSPPASPEQENPNEVALIQMDDLTGDRTVSERFLVQANWDLQEAMTQYVKQLNSSPSQLPPDSGRLVSQLFDVTGDNELSVRYLETVNWEYDAAVRLFLEEMYGGGLADAPSQVEDRADERAMVRHLTEVTGDEGKARYSLVRAEWNEEAATRLALRELFGSSE
jgi:hypothetical protein